MICNRQENVYVNLKIPEFLQIQYDGVKTHQIVVATIHKTKKM